MIVRNRLKRLEKAINGQNAGVLGWIRAGRFYDELSPNEQTAYCLYRYGMPTHPDETMYRVMETPFDKHFRLEAKPQPLTQTEYAQRVQEVEAYIAEAVRVYNAPEARAERERQYQELKRIGELRKQAFESGRSMDEYPLPWEKGNQQ